MKMKLAVLLLLIIVTLVLFQATFFGITKDFYEGVVGNLIVEALGIYIVIYFVERILKQHEEDKTWERFYKFSYHKYDVLVTKIAQNYVHCVTKKPPQFGLKREDVKCIVENIEAYIDSDFVSKPINVLIINPNNIFEQLNENWTYLMHLHFIKQEINTEISNLLSRYLTILPEEVLNSIYKIDEMLAGNHFVSTYDVGINIPNVSQVKIDVETFRNSYRALGDEIVKLMDYAEDKSLYENKKE